MKYSVIYNGARITSRSMIRIASIIAKSSKEDIRDVYRGLVGRYPSAHQMEMI
jgi:carbonic anhydrase/acetyltransferase-like protein (isoleucine patch superfamily)